MADFLLGFGRAVTKFRCLYLNSNGNLMSRGLRSAVNVKESFDEQEVEKILQKTNENQQNADNDLPDPTIKNPYVKEKQQCILCKYNVKLDYKNAQLLSQFVSRHTGRVYGKHTTGLCSTQQKRLENAIQLSKSAGFMPCEYKDVRFLKEPKLFDISRISKRF